MKKLFRIYLWAAVFAAALIFAGAPEVSAQSGKTKTVRFARGKSSIVVRDAVVRGTENRYIVSARAGQTMSVKLASREKNAEFTIYFAGGQEPVGGSEESTEWRGQLEADNAYEIVVAPTRGNATYTLTIWIK